MTNNQTNINNVLENAVAAIQRILPQVTAGAASVLGYRCLIWHPFGSGSVYGKNDGGTTRYTEVPQVSSSFLGVNLFVESLMGDSLGQEFSTFVDEQPALLTFGYKIPEESKIQIFSGSSSRWMKVRKHKSYNGSSGYLMLFNILSPLTSEGQIVEDAPAEIPESIKADPKNRGISGQNLI